MPPDIEEIFHDLLELSERDRESRLEEIGRTRPELHRELSQLLRAFDRSSGLFGRATPPLAEVRPERLGKYEVRGELGRGASGIVYLGYDPSLGREVAIKVLLHALSAANEDELRTEARSLANVVHPNVAQVYSVEADEAGRTFLTMEFVPGRSLGEFLREGPLPPQTCLDYGRQIASALEAAHHRSIVHRDLKPYNIRVTPDGWIKVLDFGLAYRTSSASTDGSHEGAGTPGYMSPEQCRRDSIDHRSDLWAFGAVLYECLTGQALIQGKTVRDVYEANRTGSADLSALPHTLPPRTVGLMRAALVSDPESRLDSATTARQVLEEELLRLRAMTLLRSSAEPVDQTSAESVDQTSAESGTRTRPSGNLPNPLSSFIGRQDWIEETKARLLTHRLVTMTGPGGVGKTRTSIEIARPLQTEFAGGIWFVDLAGISSPLDVAAAILRTLQIRETAPDGSRLAPAPALASMFESQAGLLIVDNCEHVLGGVAEFLEELLALDSSLTILATSRNPIGIMGEEVAILPPLALEASSESSTGTSLESSTKASREPSASGLDESVELFLQRAQSRAPNFQVGTRGVELIRRICRRLDGLPLAIELAAGQSRALPLEETLRRIEAGRSLGKLPGTHPRHQSLNDLVDWSYRLLPPKERALLRRMTVFRGGCTLAAIEEVCGDWGGIDRWEVCDLVARLVEASLVEPMNMSENDASRNDVRYRLLETIRSFAVERRDDDADLELSQAVGSGAVRTERERLESVFIDYASRLVALRDEEKGPTRSKWVARVDPDYSNLIHALELSLQSGRLDVAYTLGDLLTYHWFQMGQWVAGDRWMNRILEARSTAAESRPASLPSEVQVLAQAGFLSTELRQLEKGRSLVAESISTGETLGDPSSLAFAHQIGGITAWRRQELDEAETHFEQSLHYAKQAKDRGAIVAVLGNLGVIESTRGRNDKALPYYRQHLEESRAMGDPGAIATSLGNIGWTNWALGRLEDAKSYFREALELTERIRNVPNSAMVRHNLGEIHIAQGQLEEARECFLSASRARIGIGDDSGLVSSLFALARLAEKQDRILLAAEIVTGVIERLGPRPFLITPGNIVSSEDWRNGLEDRIGSDGLARARDRVTGLDFPELLALAEAGTK